MLETLFIVSRFMHIPPLPWDLYTLWEYANLHNFARQTLPKSWNVQVLTERYGVYFKTLAVLTPFPVLFI